VRLSLQPPCLVHLKPKPKSPPPPTLQPCPHLGCGLGLVCLAPGARHDLHLGGGVLQSHVAPGSAPARALELPLAPRPLALIVAGGLRGGRVGAQHHHLPRRNRVLPINTENEEDEAPSQGQSLVGAWYVCCLVHRMTWCRIQKL
jgi:hypothetical protein